MESLDSVPQALADKADALRSQGKTAMFAAIDGRVAAVIAVADPIKETTPEAVKSLQSLGVRIVMLSGDSRTTAEAVGRQLGIGEVIGEVLPEQKVEKVKALQAQCRCVAMAGDGLHDAPALAQADLRIAIGTRTHVAIDNARATLAACAMDRSGLAQVLSAAVDHECCDEDVTPQGGDAMPMSASICASHTTSDLQAFNPFPVAITAKAISGWYTHERPLQFALPPVVAPPKAISPRILLHSFQV